MRFVISPRTRRLTVIALDVIVLVTAATAIVSVLGASGRFYLDGLRISVTGPLRPTIAAIVAILVRVAIARGHRLSPLGVSSLVGTFEGERERFAHPPPATRDVKYYALAAAVTSLVWLTPHIMNIRQVPDFGDPIFSAWRLARFAHQLTNEPTRLFDGNIFHPAPYTMTFSDATILEGLLAFPFLLAGGDPLVVSNALFLASFPLCALAFFYSGWRLTGDPQAGCVAGVLGGLSAFKIEHYSHLELQFFFFAPIAVVMALRMLAGPGWRTGALFGAAVAAQWLACMYLGVMLFVLLAPIAVIAALAWHVRPTRALTLALASAATIIIVGVSITAVPYMRSQSQRGERNRDIVRSYSASPTDYGATTRSLTTYANVISRRDNLSERELFPGTTPLVLAALGALPPMSIGSIAVLAGTAVAFDGSLGFKGLIYDDLYKYVLPFRGMRVPSRFAALVSAGLTLLSAYGARRLLRFGRTRAARGALLAILGAGALVDLRSTVRLRPYYATVPSIYASVRPDMVLAEIPMEPEPAFLYMYFSTSHWARLINGHSGYFPAGYEDLERDMEYFPQRDLLNRLKQQGATHITVNCRLFRYPWRCPNLLGVMDGMPELRLMSAATWEGAEVRLYEVR
ncbi:MAG: hypothetical protein H0W08_25530 [Acidobacteria bacterium]|nr:hypothetical protein [Acidobacteriota bacterium]